MTYSGTARFAAVLGLAIAAGIGLVLSGAVSAPSAKTPMDHHPATPPKGAATMSREDWSKAIARVRVPKHGCFKTAYPSLEWQQVACVAPPPYFQPPNGGAGAPHLDTVGSTSGDFSAAVTANHISSATGSFPTVTGVTSEAGQINATGGQVDNAYTLQLNSNFFTTPPCAGSPNTAAPDAGGCAGFEQFVYENNGGSGKVYIQYWLIKYNAACPAGGWQQQPLYGDIYCVQNNSMGATPVPNQPATNLQNLTLTGTVGPGSDSAVLTVSGMAYSVPGDDYVSASAGWKIAEFNLFGDGGGGQANFNAGSTVTVQTVVHNGTTDMPTCDDQSFTGETNNLTLVGTPAIPIQPSPTIQFIQSNVPGTAGGCSAAQGIGDTHLTTFAGLLYDFQASGDFLLAQVGSDFAVENRQVSGAPTWPEATVNKAVAVRMGKTSVGLCLSPDRLVVDGKTAELRDGRSLAFPGGGGVSHSGSVYLIRDRHGNSVRAEFEGAYMDVFVGLGHAAGDNAHGLLAGPDIDHLRARDGTVLAMPVSFDDLYHRYGDSWRVPGKASLVTNLCGSGPREVGDPKTPFYAGDLDPKLRQRALAICTAAGVKQGPLLEACTLDVAVLGEKAARVFVRSHPPRAVARLRPPGH